MSKSENSHNIQGSWRGKYYYAGEGRAFGFEAVFIEYNGAIEGNILDDGDLGEAIVGGSFSYPNVKFTKRYRRVGLDSPNYQGTMSEDGKKLSGKWLISKTRLTHRTISGPWVAMRLDDGTMEELDKLIDKELFKELEPERILVTPGVQKESGLS